MENKKLAIKGHSTRGKEVIEILEMLGGQNISNNKGNGPYLYYINDNNFIGLKNQYQTNFIIFTLEQFIEKYPYKVGDKCKYNGHVYFYRQQKFVTISSMCYVNDTIEYRIDNGIWVKAEDLQPYKEEIRQERKYPELRMDLNDDDKLATEVVIGGDKILPPNGYLIGKITQVDNGMLIEFVKKQPQYPKTYNECYEIMDFPENQLIKCGVYGYKAGLLSKFQELLICRDAYWKIAGEEMGLSEPWKPKYISLVNNEYFTIHTFNNEIIKSGTSHRNAILAFPTEEMRDAFYENFKDLIEKCKELL